MFSARSALVSSVTSALTPRFVFWWLLLVVVQQAQRIFLIGAEARRDASSPAVLGLTLLTGLRADLVTASFGMIVVLVVAVIVAAPFVLGGLGRAGAVLVRTVTVAAAILTVAYVVVLTVDMGYYLYSGHRLEAGFIQYLNHPLGPRRQGAIGGSQVGTQRAAEISDVGTWAVRVVSYAAVLTPAILGWRLAFRRAVAPRMCARPRVTAIALPVAVAVGAWGVHPDGPDSV